MAIHDVSTFMGRSRFAGCQEYLEPHVALLRNITRPLLLEPKTRPSRIWIFVNRNEKSSLASLAVMASPLMIRVCDLQGLVPAGFDVELAQGYVCTWDINLETMSMKSVSRDGGLSVLPILLRYLTCCTIATSFEKSLARVAKKVPGVIVRV